VLLTVTLGCCLSLEVRFTALPTGTHPEVAREHGSDLNLVLIQMAI